MVSPTTFLTEGSRIFVKSLQNRFAPQKFAGNANEICKEIIDLCFNGHYFQTSLRNFSQFWTRDFGFCTQSLVQLGHKEKVHQTLRYALNRFQQKGFITTTITPQGAPYDFPRMAVDSLPWLMHSIRVSSFPIYNYKDFLRKQVALFVQLIVDPKTGLVYSDKQFSSIKDFSIRHSSCYDNCMLGLLSHELDLLKLENPLKKYDYSNLLVKYFWSGKYFYDDLQKKDYVAGDANLFPFLLGVVSDKDMLHKAFSSMEDAGLVGPFPLKYTAQRKEVRFIWQEVIMRNYESNAIWMHMGPLYVKLLKSVDEEKAKMYKEKYSELIEKAGNFLEVYEANGKPYANVYYHCDQGMLWAANYLTL